METSTRIIDYYLKVVWMHGFEQSRLQLAIGKRQDMGSQSVKVG
jgi:hypothetical protein